MELDELKAKWAEHDRKLDESIRLNRQLLRDTYTRRARFALWRLAAMLAMGSIFMLVIVVSLGRFIAETWSTPRFVWPAVAMDLLSIATLAALIAQIGLALNIDYNQPVAVIQKRLETLRRFRIRYVQAICISVTLIWMPIFIVVMKAFPGVPGRWIWTNVAFGFVVLALEIWLFKKYGPRMSLAGYNLNAASGFLATLAEFENDHSPQDRSSIREYSPDEKSSK
jgi:hypothetical protein